MAAFSTSNLLKAQAILADRFKAAEGRFKPSPVLALGLSNPDVLIPDYKNLRKREDRPVSGYLQARNKRATSASRTHNHTGPRDDSFETPFVWQTFTDVFSISLTQLDTNVLEFNTSLANSFYNAIKNILEDAETYGVNWLHTNRTQVNNAILTGWNAANDVFEISEEDRFAQILKAMMRQNNHTSELDVISNSAAFLAAEFHKNQGSGNSTNTNFQYSGLNFVEAYELTDANYSDGFVLAMPTGSFAALPWIKKQARDGWGDYNSYNGGWGSMPDPFGLGLDIAIHGYAQRADASGQNGSTQDVVMEWELSVDIAYAKSPLSVANETTIFAAAQV